MKSLGVFFILLLLFAAVPVQGQNGVRETHEFEDWEYITNTTGLTLTSYQGNSRNVVIPESIYGINVTELGENLFKSNISLQTVVIPDTVNAIGSSAFHGCTALTEVNLPPALIRIESNTFRYCTSLEHIQLPSGLTVISSYAFSGCIGLVSMDLPDSLTSIGESAFDDCSFLENVKMSINLTYLGTHAFRNTPWFDSLTDEFVIMGNSILFKYNGLSSSVEIPYGVTMIVDAFIDNLYVERVTVPNSVTRIGPRSFEGAVNLSEVIIPNSVTRIDGYAFYNCRSLRSIKLPDSIALISGSALRGCEKLTEFEFPSSVTSISSYVLADCKSLTDVVIPSTVTEIHTMAFSNSDLVRLHVTYGSVGEQFAQENQLSYSYYVQQTSDYLFSKNENGIQILLYVGNLFDVDVPSEIDGLPVNRINTAAFQNNPIPKRITLPNTIQTIGDWAFSYMDSLEEIRISSDLVSLGSDAFTGSKQLKEIVLPISLESIGAEPFAEIPELRIYAPEGSYAEAYLVEAGYQKEELADQYLNQFTMNGLDADEKPLVPTAEIINSADDTAPVNMAAAVPGTEISATETPAGISASPTPTEVPPTATPTLAAAEQDPAEDPTLDPTKQMLQMTVDALKARKSGGTTNPTATPFPTFVSASEGSPSQGTGAETVGNTAVPTATAALLPSDTPAPTATAAVPTSTLVPTATATEMPTDTPVPTSTATQLPTAVSVVQYRVISIPDGVTEITSDMLQNTAYELTLIIPKSVEHIDEQVAAEHDLTIVSSIGSAAEQYARQFDVKFLLDTWYVPETDAAGSLDIDVNEITTEAQR